MLPESRDKLPSLGSLGLVLKQKGMEESV